MSKLLTQMFLVWRDMLGPLLPAETRWDAEPAEDNAPREVAYDSPPAVDYSSSPKRTRVTFDIKTTKRVEVSLAKIYLGQELLCEVLPRAQRIALVTNPQHPGERKEFDVAQASAQRLGLTVRYLPVSSSAALDTAFADIAKTRDDAIVAFADGFTLGHAARFAEFSRQTRIPAIDGWAPFAEAGNLMIYGPVITDVYRRLAQYVDRIAKGAAPGDLPIELPTKVELVVNAGAAKAMGIQVPSSVLARADRVIA